MYKYIIVYEYVHCHIVRVIIQLNMGPPILVNSELIK